MSNDNVVIDETKDPAKVKIWKDNKEAINYLRDTDWYITREFETGVLCPVEIKESRAMARAKVINI